MFFNCITDYAHIICVTTKCSVLTCVLCTCYSSLCTGLNVSVLWGYCIHLSLCVLSVFFYAACMCSHHSHHH